MADRLAFEQVAPRRAEAADGTSVELVDRHHAQLHGPLGTWLVELGPGDDEDWFSIRVYGDTLVRAGGDADEQAREDALAVLVAGIKALRVRVGVDQVFDDAD